MTSFVHTDHLTDHPGVIRAERAADSFKQVARNAGSARGAAAVLLAAMVSALLVVANQIIDTWSDGHLLAAWILMWTLAFGALALLATPARRSVLALRAGLKRWATRRREVAPDEQMWQVVLSDPGVMADIARGTNLSARAQRLMRAHY